MKKFILLLIFFLAVYIGCVVWITWGIIFRPIDKFLICSMSIIPIMLSCGIAEINDWFKK